MDLIHPQSGNSALHDASEKGHLSVVKLLLQKGAEVNIIDKVHLSYYYLKGLSGWEHSPPFSKLYGS